MKRIWVALALASAAGPALAQSFSPDRVKADVSYLADDLLEGRNAGTRGYDIAAAYVASRFAALGLQPGNGTSFYQPVTFVQSSIKDAPDAGVRINGTLFRNGEDIVYSGNPRYPELDQDVELVFVGHGFEDKRYGFDDYAGLDVKGKVVVFLASLPQGAPSDIIATLGDRRGEVAAAKGAVGTMTLLDPVFAKQFPWDRAKEYGGVARLRWTHPDGRPEMPNATLRYGAMLGPKAAEALFAGAKMSAAEVYAKAAQPNARLKGFALPAKVHYKRLSETVKSVSSNVVALLPGSDPALAKEVVIFSAHLDHDGIVKAENGDTIMNGAMDNAAGVATMLEAARAFIDSGQRPKRSILFAAVTAEEDGLLGSEYMATYPVLGDRKAVAVVNLDMPILTYEFQDLIAFGAEHSTLGPIVDKAVAAIGVKLSPDPMPEEGLFTRSDHYSWVQKGIPAVFLATGSAGQGKAASQDFLSNHYHRVSDDMTRPFNWQAGAKFAQVNYLIGRAIADAPEAPRWYGDSFFGSKFAKDQPKATRPR